MRQNEKNRHKNRPRKRAFTWASRLNAGVVYMSRADSCHEYLFQATEEDLNQIKDVFASKLHQFFFYSFILRKFWNHGKILIKQVGPVISGLAHVNGPLLWL